MRIPKFVKNQTELKDPPLIEEDLRNQPTLSVDEFLKEIEATLEARPWYIKKLAEYKLFNYSAAYYFKNPHLIPKDGYTYYRNRIKWFYQRGKRGFSDYDLWGFDSYLDRVIINGLKEFKKNMNSYPGALTPETWDEVLDDIITGFERNAARRDELAWPTLEDKEDWEKTMRLFGRWYNDLWD